MNQDDLAERWRNFSEQNPGTASRICEIALKVCSISDAKESLDSENFRLLGELISENHKELGLPIDMGEIDILRWATHGVFKKILASERRSS